MSAEILICPLCHTPRMPRKKGHAWFWGCQNYTACTETTTMTPLVPQNLHDRGESTETNKSTQRGLVSEEEDRHSSQKMEGHTELDLLQDEVGWAGEWLWGAHLEEQSAQNKRIETAFRLEQAMEKMSLITKLLEVNLEPAGQSRQARKNVCWVASKRQSPYGENFTKLSRRRRNYRATLL